MCNFFYVDTENIGSSFLEGKDTLKAGDIMHLYHNDDRELGFSPAYLLEMNSSAATVNVVHIKAENQKNAVDFHIVTRLVHDIEKYGNRAKYYIVSYDRGYEAAITAIRSLYEGIEVNLINTSDTNMVENDIRFYVKHTFYEESKAVRKAFSRVLIEASKLEGDKKKEWLNYTKNGIRRELYKDHKRLLEVFERNITAITEIMERE